LNAIIACIGNEHLATAAEAFQYHTSARITDLPNAFTGGTKLE
jgi:hypothetical protein